MIEFCNVDKYYASSQTRVFKDFSMRIERGEFVLITGVSGSGKSTLIRLLLRDELADGGKIFVRNKDISGIPERELPYYRRGFGVIFQDFRLIKDLNVYDNIELARIAIGGSKKDSPTRIGNIMKLLRISELRKRKITEISGGQQQKVCLARALINNPDILLADEPTANLDPTYTQEMLRLFEVIHSQGSTVVVATQDPILMASERARKICLSPDDLFEAQYTPAEGTD